jgi:hypothetical protein
MADGIESFSASRNLARVAAGLKGGPFFAKPNLAPSMNFVEGYPKEVMHKLEVGAFPQPMPQDAWNMRRANAGGK